VLRSANFNDGRSNGFSPDSGIWAVRSGRLEVAPAAPGGDAVSVFLVGEAFPSYLEVLATVNQDKPVAGYKSNAYLVFDYRSETDFKFAGIDISNNQLEIGHRTVQGWVLDAQTGIQVRPAVNYRLTLSLNDVTAAIDVAGIGRLSYTFAPRFDADGFRHGLNDGMVGVGAQNSKGRFDDVVVQVPRRGITFEYREDFLQAAPTLFSGPETGSWKVEGTRCQGLPAEGSDTAIRSADVGGGRRLEVSSRLELETRLSVETMGGLVFDQYGPDDFKFVALLPGSGQVAIGHHTARGGWSFDAVASRPLGPGPDQDLGVVLRGSQATVSLNGQTVLSHLFNGVVVDGAFGLFTRGGSGSFDSFTVRTDDPGLRSPLPPPGGGEGTLRDPLVMTAAGTSLPAARTAPTAGPAVPWAGPADWVIDLEPQESPLLPRHFTWEEAMLRRATL
jgi:hypothetical protein